MANGTIRIKVRKYGDFDIRQKKSKAELSFSQGMRQMIEDIHRFSKPITPKLTGDLRKNVVKTRSKIGDIVRGSIEWTQPYARPQERGYTTGPVKNYTTPGTGKQFALRSVNAADKNYDKYFGKAL